MFDDGEKIQRSITARSFVHSFRNRWGCLSLSALPIHLLYLPACTGSAHYQMRTKKPTVKIEIENKGTVSLLSEKQKTIAPSA